ncbi:MAG: thioredoxin family protein [Halofilum sp. (in: g-proteobacteria)]
MTETIGWLAVATLAGILLNATPCVLPAIPLKLRVLLAEGGQSPRRRLMTAMALVAGSLTFFVGLGALSTALQWTWGAPMGSPVFRATLTGVLALAGLALILDIGRLPLPQRLAQWQASGPLEGFAVGLGGGVLSLPCTGPFLGGVLAFSLTQPPAMVLALFAGVGLGMAAPYVVLLACPHWMPRGGLPLRFGATVPRLLGFGLLAGAVFYGQSFLPSTMQGARSGWIVVAALTVWAALSWRRRAPRVEQATALGATVAVAALLASGALHGGPARLDWQVIDRAAAAPAAVDGPALIEFTADWCLNCQVLERTVYQEPDVARAAGDTVRTYRVDLTQFDDAAQALLRSWGGNGLPYAVVIDGDGEIERRLRDLFPASELTRALEQVANDAE